MSTIDMDWVHDLIERHSDHIEGNTCTFHNGAYARMAEEIAATVGNGTDLSKRLREVTGLRSFAELFGFSWEDGSDWDWHDVACAMADAIDATAGAKTSHAVACNVTDCIHNRECRCTCADLEIQDQECMTYSCRDIDYDEEDVIEWMEGTMICDTVWDEPPEAIVFKGKHDWPFYVPERTASIVKVPRQSHVALGHYECGGCGQTIDAGDRYCRKCGACLEGASE